MIYWFRHHDEAPNRPRIVDHAVATVVLSTLVGAYFTLHPANLFCCAWFGLMLVTPYSWMMGNMCKPGVHYKHHNIFYENGCTAEEIERFRHQDQVESMGQTFLTQPGQGYVPLKDARGL